jgi:DNA repair exonuclease SbcCD nuclease subunit
MWRSLTTFLHDQGVWERDEWRGNDSFDAFKEVISLAKTHAVDMVLLGGDLFHENKPSRRTLVKCLDILNSYCLSDQAIQLEVRDSLTPRSNPDVRRLVYSICHASYFMLRILAAV